jgi:hypothetical protein
MCAVLAAKAREPVLTAEGFPGFGRELEPVVPGTAGGLYGFKASGSLLCQHGASHGFRDVAGELGCLAEIVKAFVLERGRDSDRFHVTVCGMYANAVLEAAVGCDCDGKHDRGGDPERFSRLQNFGESFEPRNDRRLLCLDEGLQLPASFIATAAELGSEAVNLPAKRDSFRASSLRLRKCGEQVEVDIEVAHFTCGGAELMKLSGETRGFMAEGRQPLQVG